MTDQGLENQEFNAITKKYGLAAIFLFPVHLFISRNLCFYFIRFLYGHNNPQTLRIIIDIQPNKINILFGLGYRFFRFWPF
mgnify:CR=1 FL=1